MNRRSFLRNSALALFGFAILPPATTYERVWRAERKLLDLEVFKEEIYRCFMLRPKQQEILYSQAWMMQWNSSDNIIIENFSRA